MNHFEIVFYLKEKKIYLIEQNKDQTIEYRINESIYDIRKICI